MTTRRGIVIAGGGTGGHIVPSLQIARALVERGHAAGSIELYGSRRGQEATVWPPLEFRYTLLPGRGIRASNARGCFDVPIAEWNVAMMIKDTNNSTSRPG